MSIEAMKQALEALETLDAGDTYKTHNAASALRQAIEEAEKPWVKTYAGGKPNYTTPIEKQEPVAQCTYPQCQATNGCVGACSKTAPVHASDISQERVDETAKHGHEPVAWHEPGAYGNVTTHKDWALANGWEPLYKERT